MGGRGLSCGAFPAGLAPVNRHGTFFDATEREAPAWCRSYRRLIPEQGGTREPGSPNRGRNKVSRRWTVEGPLKSNFWPGLASGRAGQRASPNHRSPGYGMLLGARNGVPSGPRRDRGLRFEQLERRIDTMVTRLVTASDLATFGERVTSGSAAGRWA